MKLKHNFQIKVIHLPLTEVTVTSTFAPEVREVAQLPSARPQMVLEKELSTVPIPRLGGRLTVEDEDSVWGPTLFP